MKSVTEGLRGPILPYLLLLALTGISACEKKEPLEKPEVIRLVRVTTASIEATRPTLSFAGDVRARYESQPGFRVSGKLVERHVDVGDSIRPGQVLARLDDKDLRLGLEAAQARLNQARAEKKLAAQNYDRYADLYKRGAVSKAEFDRINTALQSASEAVAAAAAQSDQARNQLAYAELIADYDGVVSAVLIEVGQVVSAGLPVFDVERSGEREVELSVPEQQRDAVIAAAEIDIRLWALPGKSYRGRLRELAPSADPVTRTYAVRVGIENPDEDIKPGMTARVYFQGDGGDAIVLPMSALYTTTDQPQVWRVNPDNTVSAVDVTTGVFVGNQVTIESGIEVGDKIVTAGANLLIPGQKVRLLESTQ
ncbi:MAG: efflux RND transporter periplasmic adaptor subunit [Gammaproteobacteria bacterium]|nr:efflux RND transporter periplasmic adaptor subunit [Gammaproteobacteria bacterium]